jgi:hypothetical protein
VRRRPPIANQAKGAHPLVDAHRQLALLRIMLSFNLPSSLTLLLLTATASSWTFARPSASCAPVFNADASPDQLAIPSRATTDTDVDTSPNSNNFSWRNTKNIISFGDSYTQTGWDVTKGVNSTDPGAVRPSHPVSSHITCLSSQNCDDAGVWSANLG